MNPSSVSPAGRWRLAAFLIAAGWWCADLLLGRAGTPDRMDDVWEYGAVARALIEGQGFRTPVIHPPLWTLRDALGHVPVLVHGPVIPLILVPGLAWFGPGALDGIAFLSALAALAVLVPLGRLGERWGHPAIGFAAALLWTFSPLTLRSVHHDVAVVVGAALLLAAIELATRPAEEGGPRAVPAGVALGLACLVRHELLAALPMLAWRLRGARRGFLVAALAMLAPWWLHHAMAVGQPFFNLSTYMVIGYQGPWPGLTSMRDFSLTPARFGGALRSQLPAIAAKLVELAPHALKRMLFAPGPALGGLAPVGLAFAFASHRLRRDAITLAGVGLIPIAVMSVTTFDDRYIVPILPLLTLLVAAASRSIAAMGFRGSLHPAVWIGALLLALAPSFLAAAREGFAESKANRDILSRERIALRERFGDADAPDAGPAGRRRILFSDTPDFVAWTTGRPTVWLTSEEAARLPAESRVPELPSRPGDDETWFHPGKELLSR